MDNFSAWMLRNSHRIQWTFFGLFGALFLFAIGDALRLVPGEPGWRPRAMVVLSLGLLLQPIASLVGNKSRALRLTLLVLSVALCVGSLRISG